MTSEAPPSGPPGPFIYNPPAGQPKVLHEDEHILVLSKPSGLLTVPGKPLEHRDCLESRVSETYPDARIVHRLDLDTSGIVIMARSAEVHRHLGLQFERRKTDKVYIARVWGLMNDDEGLVDLPLICDWPNRPKQMVDHEQGKPAQTKWQVLDRDTTTTRVKLFPLTGRSHQLRVHMLSLGHPILGDNFYAHPKALSAADRLQLHAEQLTIHHPSDGERISFIDPCPF